MTAALAPSSRLLNSALVTRKDLVRDAVALEQAKATVASASVALAGNPTLAPRNPDAPKRYPSGFGPYGERARQKRVYDRAASRQRKRERGGDGRLPNTIRYWFTEGERAVLSVIADRVKKYGLCDWPVEKIASRAGVSIRLTQYAIATASWKAANIMSLPKDQRPPLLILVEYRPRRGAKSLPSVIKIISRVWINWLSYQPSEAPAVEAAEEGPWSTFDAYAGRMRGVMGIGCRKKHTSQKPSFGNHQEEPRTAEIADGWQRLRRGMPLQLAYERERAGPHRPSGGGQRG